MYHGPRDGTLPLPTNCIAWFSTAAPGHSTESRSARRRALVDRRPNGLMKPERRAKRDPRPASLCHVW